MSKMRKRTTAVMTPKIVGGAAANAMRMQYDTFDKDDSRVGTTFTNRERRTLMFHEGVKGPRSMRIKSTTRCCQV
jgi:hypothetical protein